MTRLALVVGIDRYPTLPPLPLARQGAIALAQRLTHQGQFTVEQLPPPGLPSLPPVGTVPLATLKAHLLRLFQPQGIPHPTTALFYFAGYGWFPPGEGLEGFLATSDSLPQGPQGLSLLWLQRLLRDSPVRQWAVILDCCQGERAAGSLALGEGDPGEQRGYDRLFLSAGWPPGSMAPFSLTQSLLEALNPDRTDTGLITTAFVHNWVRTTLDDRLPQGHWQQSGSPWVLVRPQGDPCPYKGLAYFDCNAEDPQFFHGREALTQHLLTQVQQRPFLAVVGPSGSGKSSLLRAGLVHQLRLGQAVAESDRWHIYVVQPGSRPLLNLAFAFLDLSLPLVQRAQQLADIEQFLSQGWPGMRRLIQALGVPRLVVVVDQFEELLTLCPDPRERLQFLDCLLGGLGWMEEPGEPSPAQRSPAQRSPAQGSPTHPAEAPLPVPFQVILGMRSDCFALVNRSAYGNLGALIRQHHCPVPPLSPPELEAAICQPAQALGVTLEPELVQQMIADVGGASHALPLLQYTLTELWHQRGSNPNPHHWPLQSYVRLGGLRGTLEKQADGVYDTLTPPEQAAAQHIFLALTHLGEGTTEDSRRPVFQGDLATARFPAALIDRVIQRLVQEKLLVTSAWAPPGTGFGEDPIVEVIHEALIRHWGLLRQWIRTYGPALRQYRQIHERAEQWWRKGQGADYLLQGQALQEAQAVINPGMDLPWAGVTLVEAFLQASQGAEEQRHRDRQDHQEQLRHHQHQAQRRHQQLQGLGVGAGGLLGITLLWIGGQHQALETQTLTTLTQQVTQAVSDRRDLEAQRLALEVSQRWQSAKIPLPFSFGGGLPLEDRVTAALQQALYSTQQLNQIPTPGGVISLSVNPQTVAHPRHNPNPDQPLVVTGDRQGQVQLFNPWGQELGRLTVPQVAEVAWSADGLKFATVSKGSGDGGGKAQIWNAQGQPLATLPLPPGDTSALWDVAWSRDGGELVATGDGGQVYRWRSDGTALGNFAAHGGWIYDVALSPTGETIATAGGDGSVGLWNPQGQSVGTLKHPPATPGHWVHTLAFSPDGKMLATGSTDGCVRLWDVQGDLRGILDPGGDRAWQPGSGDLGCGGSGDGEGIVALAFSPDGQTLTSARQDGSLHFWDTRKGQILSPLRGGLVPQGGDRLYDLGYSGTGDVLVTSGQEGTVRLWDLSPQAQWQQPAHGDRVLQVAYSPQGTAIATSATDGQITLWDPQGRPLAHLQGHQGWALTVAFSPDGQRLASGGSDGTLRLWDPTGRLLHSWDTGQGWVYGVAFRPDGQGLGSRGRDGTLRLWDLQGNSQGTIAPPSDTSEPIYHFTFSPNGQWLATRSDRGTVALWKLPLQGGSSRPTTILGQGQQAAADPASPIQGEIYDLAFTPNSDQIATAGADGTVRLWDLQGQPRSVLRSNSAPIYSLSLSPQGDRLATGSTDGSTRLWNRSGKLLATLPKAQEPVWQVQFSPDGKTLATRSNGSTARLWDVATARLIAPLAQAQGPVWGLHFSPDSRQIVTHTAEGLAQIWSREGAAIAPLQNPQGQVTTLALDPQGEILASGGTDGMIRLWTAQGTAIATLLGHEGAVWQVAFSPDGELLASTSADGTVRLWSRQPQGDNPSEPWHPIAQGREVGSPATLGLAFSPQGHEILVSDASGLVGRWSIQGKALGEFRADTQGITALAWSRDQRTIATGHRDGSLKLWDRGGKLLEQRSAHPSAVTALAFGSGGSLASAGAEGTAILWNPQGQPQTHLRGHRGPIQGIQFSPQGHPILTSGADGTLRLWSRSGQALAIIPAQGSGLGGGITAALFTPDGTQALSGDQSGQIQAWSLGNPQQLQAILCQRLALYLGNPATALDRPLPCPAAPPPTQAEEKPNS